MTLEAKDITELLIVLDLVKTVLLELDPHGKNENAINCLASIEEEESKFKRIEAQLRGQTLTRAV